MHENIKLEMREAPKTCEERQNLFKVIVEVDEIPNLTLWCSKKLNISC